MHQLQELRPLYEAVRTDDTDKIVRCFKSSHATVVTVLKDLENAAEVFGQTHTAQDNPHPRPHPIPVAEVAISRVKPFLGLLVGTADRISSPEALSAEVTPS
jgi:hypothetical protein